MNRNSAIVVVDMLYDFIDGTLACLNAEDAVEHTVSFIKANENHTWGNPPVLFIRDCHPSNHCSFKSMGGDWPEHCVEGTHGAQIHEKLLGFVNEDLTFFKGKDPSKEQYSGAEGLNAASQTLVDVLNILDCENIYVCGIATEFCVLNTVEDLLKAGFAVTVLQDCLAYVSKDGHDAALKEMKKSGAKIV